MNSDMNTVSRHIGAFLINYRPLHSLRRQFTLVLLLLGVLVAAFGATAIYALNQSRTATQKLATQQLGRLQASHDLVWQILSASALAEKLVKTSSAAEAVTRFADLEAELKKTETLVDKLSGGDNDLNVLDLQYSNRLFSATASAVVQQRGMLQSAHQRFDVAYRRSYDKFSDMPDSANNANARLLLETLQTTVNASTVRQLRTTFGNLPGVAAPWSDDDNDPFALRLLELDRQATIDLLQNALRQHVLNLMTSAREQSDHFARDYRDGVLNLAQTIKHRQIWMAVLLSVILLMLWLIASQFIGRHVLGRMRIVSHYLRLDLRNAAGDGNAASIPVAGTDEIAEMARALERRLADSAELQKARKLLEESQSRLTTIIEHAADGFVIVQEGVIRQLNPAAKHLLGWEPGGLPQLDMDSLTNNGSRNSPVPQVDTMARTQDGREVPVEVSVSEVDLPTGRAMILVIRDATTRRENARQLTSAKDAAESAQAANASFLADVAGEFDTPLNAILNHTQILESDPLLSDLVRRRVETIDQNARQLRRLTKDILDLARIEANGMALDICQFDLGYLLRTAADKMVVKCESKGLALRRDWAADLPAIHGDEKRLRQILQNLLGNAITFTSSGFVKLRVEWLTANTDSGILRFEVEDSGAGIGAADLEQLLQRMARAGSLQAEAGQTGLGLAICSRLLALMGSRLQARSTPGAGSVFWFDLPVVYA